jgi:hypothetical protein
LPKDDFTLAQANDLARYFLGPNWKAIDLRGGTHPYLLEKSPADPVGWSVQGESWREAFRAAGVQLPLRPQYVAQGVRVMLADRAICTAVSNTMAKRVAAALNDHIPDRRGI